MKKSICLLGIMTLFLTACNNSSEQSNKEKTIAQKLNNQTFTNQESGFSSYITFEAKENDSTGLMTFSNSPTEVVFRYQVLDNIINVQFDHIVKGNGVNLSQLTYTTSETVGDYIYTYIGSNKYDFYNQETINTFTK